MLLKVDKSKIKSGSIISIPGSKSHTIRALFIASLASGRSEIMHPLVSDDAFSAVEVCKALGAKVTEHNFKVYSEECSRLGLRERTFKVEGYAPKILGVECPRSANVREHALKVSDMGCSQSRECPLLIVEGFDGVPSIPDDVINVGNSGTTLRFGVTAAALSEGYTVFTGDGQIRNRPMEPLIKACNNLGAKVFSTRNNGMVPVVVKGRMKGGITEIDAYTSQFLSSLLVTCPLLEKDTEIIVTQLNEKPYVEMTLWWLDQEGITYSTNNFKSIYIQGGQKYKPLKVKIPGDFSSATFFMVLAAISRADITLENLDITDPQGDKLILSFLENMGAEVSYNSYNKDGVNSNSINIKGGNLCGIEIDMNSTPDAIPAMAVAGCFAEGETKLLNVPQARLKETDRISVMCRELRKMGADITELPDGLIVRESRLKGCEVNGHYDHRVVMALAIAGLNAEGTTIIDTAEAINVTFPDFGELVKNCGGGIEFVEEM
ncbi:MAG TPA: 3-phosphoshikimate 1-carboxyvinyltransferase [Clostridiales bacterium]|nr:3-phosphoshikimate 1-carboxyvinyltransferase [Clostridiales bacterium]